MGVSTVIRNNSILESDDRDVDVEIISPTNLVGSHPNLVPFANNAQGARIFYASKFVNQVMPLKDPEAPLILVNNPQEKRSFESVMGERMGARLWRSDKGGTVKSIDKDKITVTDDDGEDHDVDLYNDFEFNRKTQITNRPVVNIGDKVQPGQLLAASNYTDDNGTLSMGKNARVALIPYKGWSMDDAVVVSESFANRMASQHSYESSIQKDTDTVFGKNHYASVFPTKFTTKQLENIGDDGIVKPGTVLHKGDPILLATRPKQINSNAEHLGKLGKLFKSIRSDAAEVWEHEYPGYVTDSIDGKKNAKAFITAEVPLTLGDKLVTSRPGQKCAHPDTELLTPRGWVRIGELRPEDTVAALFDANKEAAKINSYIGDIRYYPLDLYAAFVQPVAYTEHEFDGELYGLDIPHAAYLVTGNHRVLCKCTSRRKGSENRRWRFVDAEKMHGREKAFLINVPFKGLNDPEDEACAIFTIPFVPTAYTSGRLGANNINLFSLKEFACFVGFYICEGNVDHTNPNNHSIIITLKERPFCRKLEQLFDKLNLKWHRCGNQYRIAANKSLCTYLRQFGKANEKHLPEWVFGLSSELLQDVIDWMWQGDGDKGKGTTFWSSSPQLIDDVGRILTLLGKRFTVSKRDKRETLNYDTYELRINNYKSNSAVSRLDGKSKEKYKGYYREYYKGKVYCVQVPGEGAILTRYKGRIMWNGNSIVSKIVPDELMIRSMDGTPFEVLINPLALPSRINTATLFELAMGKVANKQGKPIVIDNFLKKGESRLDSALLMLADAGLKSTEQVYDPVTDKVLAQPVTTGMSYIYKLHHVVESKRSERGQGSYTADFQPAKGGGENALAKRLGGLEVTALLSKGGYNTLREASTIRGTCFDPSTQVLTRRGWVSWDKVLPTDELYTKNKHGSDVAWFERPLVLIKNEFSGDLCGYLGKHLDWLVTPDHHLWGIPYIQSKLKSNYCFKTYSAASAYCKEGIIDSFGSIYHGTLPDDHILHFNGTNNRSKSMTITLYDYCRFMGWYLSEGYCTVDASGRGRVIIAQDEYVHPNEFKEIDALMRKIGFTNITYENKTLRSPKQGSIESHGHSPAGTRVKIRGNSAPLAKHLLLFGSRAWLKRIPDIIFEASPSARKAFLDAYIKGDGCVRTTVTGGYDSTHYIIGTSSLLMMHDLQRLAIMTGYGAWIGLEKIAGQYLYKHDYYRVIISNNITTLTFRKTPSSKYLGHYKVPYSGYVYCAKMRTGLLYVRRNGKCMWSGNCNDLYWATIRLGYKPADPGVPFVFNKFLALLNGAGMETLNKGNGTLRLKLFTDDDLKAKGPRLVKNGGMIKGDSLDGIDDGLFDKNLVAGDNWGYIPLNEPMINPAAESIILNLLQVKEKDLRKVLAGEMTLEEAQAAK